MRVDVFLSKVCILKSRTLAREACDRGKVLLDGEPAKGSRTVVAGNTIRLDLGVRVIEIEILIIPGKTVSKKRAPDHYRVIKDERMPLF